MEWGVRAFSLWKPGMDDISWPHSYNLWRFSAKKIQRAIFFGLLPTWISDRHMLHYDNRLILFLAPRGLSIDVRHSLSLYCKGYRQLSHISWNFGECVNAHHCRDGKAISAFGDIPGNLRTMGPMTKWETDVHLWKLVLHHYHHHS